MIIHFKDHTFEFVTSSGQVVYDGLYTVVSYKPITISREKLKFTVTRYHDGTGDVEHEATIDLMPEDISLAFILGTIVNHFLQNSQSVGHGPDQVQSASSYPSTPEARAAAQRADVTYRRKQKEARQAALKSGDPVEEEGAQGTLTREIFEAAGEDNLYLRFRLQL